MTWLVALVALLLTALAVLLLADRFDSTLLDDHPPNHNHPTDLPTDDDGDDT